MSLKSRFGIAVLLVAAVVGGFAIQSNAQDKKRGAVAEIIVITSAEGKDDSKLDIPATQAAVIRSRALVQQAIRQGNLDQLAIMEGKDAVEAVWSVLNVERSKDAENPILKLSVTNVPTKDALTILEAVVAAYRDHIKDVYKLGDQVLGDVQKVMSDLEKKMRACDEEHAEYIKSFPAFFDKIAGGSSIRQKEFALTTDQLAKTNSDLRVQRLDLKTLTHAASQPDQREAVSIKAREWGQKARLDAKEATIEAYLAYLRLEVTMLEKRQELLEKDLGRMAEDMKVLSEHDKKSDQLAQNASRARLMYADVARLLQSAKLGQANLIVRVITKPHVVE